MSNSSKHQPQLFWRRVVMRRCLNISDKASDYSADDEDYLDDIDSDAEEFDRWGRESWLGDGPQVDSYDALPMSRRRKSETFRAQYISTKELRVCVGTWNVGGKAPPDDLDVDDWLHVNEPADMYVLGLQEIVPLNAGNIFGPEDNRTVSKWEKIIHDTLRRIRPVANKIKSFSDPPSPSKFKPSDIPDIDEEMLLECDSDIGEEVHPLDDEFNGFGEFKDASVPGCANSPKSCTIVEKHLHRQFSSSKSLDRLNCLWTEDSTASLETSVIQQNSKLTRKLSGTERIGLSWPEPPIHLLSTHALERSNSFRSFKSFKAFKSFKTYNSFKSFTNEVPSDLALLAEIDLESLMKRKRRSSFVRIVSKKMVGIFITVWVHRSLRRHIRNVKVSTVGVGVMGCIGNKAIRSRDMLLAAAADLPDFHTAVPSSDFEALKGELKAERERSCNLARQLDESEERQRASMGVEAQLTTRLSTTSCMLKQEQAERAKGSISVSMSIYQTPFCFICTHLTSGEKDVDANKRNADVHEIHRRTHFNSSSSIGLPKHIKDHEKIIWLGDLNYRLNLSYEKVREFISRKEWSKLLEKDQLVRELRKGCAFDGWSEGTLKFPPTYKYEINTDKYYGEDPKIGRRTPAWCDRILSYGKGMRLLSYGRAELKLSDHRPVTAIYMAEAEVFCPRRLQRALTFTDAEIENEEAAGEHLGVDFGMSCYKVEEEGISNWER